MKFRWGIIGAGGIARAFAEDLQETSQEVYAIGSRSLEKAHNFGYGKVFYGSYQELVADPEIDAVYIATPHSHHYENALEALQANKPVLIEKAFTLNARQAQEIISIGKEKNLAIMEAMWTRFLPHIKEIKEIIDRGDIGDVLHIEASHGQNLPRAKAERLWNPQLGGGALLDLGIYPISLAFHLLGKPQKITARASLTAENVDAQTSTIFEYQSGAHALLSCTMLSQTANSAVISGSRGRIEVDGVFYAPTSFRVISEKGIIEYPNTYTARGWREEAFEFERLVRNGLLESPTMPLAETLEIMKAMDEIRRQCGVKYSVD